MSLPQPLYDVELIERNGQHFYSNDGGNTYFPGSTGIIDILSKPALVPWASKLTANYMREKLESMYRMIDHIYMDSSRYEKFADLLVRRSKKQPHIIKTKTAKIGTDAHRCFNEFILQKTPLPDGIVFDSFKLWASNEKLKVVQGDTKLISLKFGYGGSLDALGMDDEGKIVLIDFKTGNGLYDSAAYQVASYCYAYAEICNLDYIPKGVVVRFGKEKVEYERREINVQPSFYCFLTLLNLYRLIKIEPFSTKEIKKLPKEKTNVPARN